MGIFELYVWSTASWLSIQALPLLLSPTLIVTMLAAEARRPTGKHKSPPKEAVENRASSSSSRTRINNKTHRSRNILLPLLRPHPPLRLHPNPHPNKRHSLNNLVPRSASLSIALRIRRHHRDINISHLLCHLRVYEVRFDRPGGFRAELGGIGELERGGIVVLDVCWGVAC